MDSEITLKEAAQMASCSVSAVRRWVQTGLINGHKDTGQWLVEERSLKAHLAQNGATLQARSGASSKPSKLEPSEDRELTRLSEALKREQQINDELRTENRKLQEEIKSLLAGKDKGSLLSRWFRV